MITYRALNLSWDVFGKQSLIHFSLVASLKECGS